MLTQIFVTQLESIVESGSFIPKWVRVELESNTSVKHNPALKEMVYFEKPILFWETDIQKLYVSIIKINHMKSMDIADCFVVRT